jgi:hypothetical protein
MNSAPKPDNKGSTDGAALCDKPGAATEAGNLEHSDWYLDGNFVSHFPSGTDWLINWYPHDFASDDIDESDFTAELLHVPASGELPDQEELLQIAANAARLYVRKLLSDLTDNSEVTTNQAAA